MRCRCGASRASLASRPCRSTTTCPNKDAIVEGVIELSLLAEVAPPSPTPPPDWKAPVLASVLGFRRALVSHPNVLPMIAAHPPVTTGTVPYISAPMGYLVAQGFSATDASDLFSAVFSLAFGHAMLSTNYGQISLPDVPKIEFTEESFARTVGVILDGYEGCRQAQDAAADAGGTAGCSEGSAGQKRMASRIAAVASSSESGA